MQFISIFMSLVFATSCQLKTSRVDDNRSGNGAGQKPATPSGQPNPTPAGDNSGDENSGNAPGNSGNTGSIPGTPSKYFGYIKCFSNVTVSTSASGQALYAVKRYCSPRMEGSSMKDVSAQLDAKFTEKCPTKFHVSIPIAGNCTINQKNPGSTISSTASDIDVKISADKSKCSQTETWSDVSAVIGSVTCP